MTQVFGTTYANAYDALYRDKDYSSEVDLIERILAEHGCGGRRRLLDLGCGTGNHAIPLAQRGHTVTGIDISSGMLAQAVDKAKSAKLPAGTALPVFAEGDLRRLELQQRFEAVLMMFAVLGYQQQNADLIAALETVKRHRSEEHTSELQSH